MKPKTTLFALVFTTFSLTLFAQSHNKPAGYIPLYDSIYVWTQDTAGTGWDIHAEQKTVNFMYDAHGNILTETTEYNPNNFSWTKNNLYINTYDAHNNQLTDSIKSWDGSAWTNGYLNTYTYDLHNNLLTQTGQTWNVSAWLNSTLFTNTYDAHNNLLSDTSLSWVGSAWVYNNLTVYNYDGNNNMLNDTLKSWTGSAWANNQLYTNTYDANHNMLTQTFQTWGGSAWTNSTLNHYTYNAHNLAVLDTVFNWNWVWSLGSLNTYTYDASYNLLAQLNQTWNGSAWVNSNLNTYSYNADNLEVSNTTRRFGAVPLFYGDSTHYYINKALQGINQWAVGSEQLSAYPNPSYNGVFTIQMKNEELRMNNRLEVYNILGEEVYSSFTLHSSFNLSAQPNGVYLYKIVGEDAIILGQGKLVIER